MIEMHVCEMVVNINNNMDLSESNSAWANVFNKVLTTKGGSHKKKPILAKAKKDKDSKKRGDVEVKKSEIELVDEDGVVKETVMDIKQGKHGIELNDDESEEKPKKRIKLANEDEKLFRKKAEDYDKERERMLASIGTKGVVQLFNAVKEQQKDIDFKMKKVGKSETKRDKEMAQFNKRDFLDKLKKNKRKDKPSKEQDNKKKDNNNSSGKWKVLSDDYMMGAKAKDWDRNSDDDSADQDDP